MRGPRVNHGHILTGTTRNGKHGRRRSQVGHNWLRLPVRNSWPPSRSEPADVNRLPLTSLSGCPCRQSGPPRGIHTPCYAHHHQQMSFTTAAAVTPICVIHLRMRGPTVPDPKAAAAADQPASAIYAPQSYRAARKHLTRRPTGTAETAKTEEASPPTQQGKQRPRHPT